MLFKKIINWLLISGALSSSVFADTCPTINEASPYNPPAGWSTLLSPVIEGEHYQFNAAIHSLNGVYYNGQVICKYSSCPNSLCPAYALISDRTYELPNSKAKPWNQPSILAFTFTCMPMDHDPSHCIFQ